MSLGLLGNKIGMTQIFDESGNIIPVTILKVGPCVVTQIKTKSNCKDNPTQNFLDSFHKKMITVVRVTEETDPRMSVCLLR